MTDKYERCGCDQKVTGTALNVAVKFGQLSMVNFLIKQGLDLCQRTESTCDSHKSYPLELAMKHLHPEVGILLIKKGANVNQWNDRE